MSEQIYESGEYCVVCLGVDNLGRWGDANSPIIVCTPCYEDTSKFKAWIMREMEEGLAADPEMEKLPNGKWKRKELSS